MLDQVDLGRELTKEDYQQRMPDLRCRLFDLQKECWDKRIASIVIFEGWDAAGKGTTIAALTERLDPRGFRLHATYPPRNHEKRMPWLWRFWLNLPNYGEMAIFDQSWYIRPLVERIDGLVGKREWMQSYQDILDFERTLADDGYVIIKFFLHIDKREQAKRFKKLRSDELTRWRVSDGDLAHHAQYKKIARAVEDMLDRTESEWGPWTIVEATDHRWTRVKIFETLIRRLEEASKNVLEKLDNKQEISREEYDQQLLKYQGLLRELGEELRKRKRSVIIVYEGWDAAGKGGSIRRVTEHLDPRSYDVFPISAPAGEDKTHQYLWRFWRRLKPPDEKQVLIFDRSWYGRVLVERVEGFAQPSEWGRAYREINDFERQLTDAGASIIKFWMHITKDEQLRRFRQRENTPHKRWKLTDDDWRNRKRWNDYEAAVEEMLLKTSTRVAPWTVVEANFKWYARVKCLRVIVERLSQDLNYEPSLARAIQL